MNYQMLPHARPGGIAGLLELAARQGRHATTSTASPTTSPSRSTTCFPIVDAAQLLGFLKVEEGDAAITAERTRSFANSEILRQKELFRDAALENVLLLRQIRRALDAKSDHTVPEEFFLDMLDEQFSEEETLRQIETAINWGRYAELFDFDAGAPPLRHARSRRHPEAAVEETSSEIAARPHALALAGAGAHLAGCPRPGRRGFAVWPPFYGVVLHGPLLVGPSSARRPISQSARALPLYAFYSIVRIGIAYLLSLVFAIGYGYYRRLPSACRSLDDRGARHPAIDPGAQLSARRDAGDGLAGAHAPAWHRDGRHPADLHRPGVEPGLQLLFLAQAAFRAR